MAKKGKRGKKARRARTEGKFFKSKSAAHKAAAGHWGTHIQYVRKAKGGYKLYRYKK